MVYKANCMHKLVYKIKLIFFLLRKKVIGSTFDLFEEPVQFGCHFWIVVNYGGFRTSPQAYGSFRKHSPHPSDIPKRKHSPIRRTYRRETEVTRFFHRWGMPLCNHGIHKESFGDFEEFKYFHRIYSNFELP